MANTLKFGNGNWATKEDSVLAYNDENNNFKPLPFDFTRASTATYVDSDGLIKTSRNGEARIDYTDSTDGALLLEPSRSNLITYSQDFSNYFVVLGVIAEAGFTDPSGNTTAFKLSNFANASSRFDYSTPTPPVNGTTYTYSAYYKGSGTIRINCSTTTGVGGSGEKEIVLTDEWKREEVSFTALNATGNVRTHAAITRASNNDAIVYLAFTQIEVGSYATSYIPTSGSAATRVADVCDQNPVTGIIGQTELTVFYQGIVERLGGSDGHAIALSQSANAAGSSRILLYRYSGDGNMYLYIQDSTTQFSTPLLVNSNPEINDKYAIAVKDNDLVVYCNGVKIAENTSGTIPATEYIYLNKWNNITYEQSKIKDVKLYNTRLSNSELITLTT